MSVSIFGIKQLAALFVMLAKSYDEWQSRVTIDSLVYVCESKGGGGDTSE